MRIPRKLKDDLRARMQDELAADTLLRFQSISVDPGIKHNVRYVLKQDGRLFYAANQQAVGDDFYQLFDTPLPEQPNRVLSADVLDKINTLLDEEQFFKRKPYIAEKYARGGTVIIITARRGDQTRDVWYRSVSNPLLDYLQTIKPDDAAQAQDDLTELFEWLKQEAK